MAQSNQTQQMLVTIRDLACSDQVALDKWPVVVDHIVQSAADILRIKDLLNNFKFHEGVLQTLNIWWGAGRDQVDLVQVLRNLKLNSLAGKNTN